MIPNNLPAGTKIRCIQPTEYTSRLIHGEIYKVLEYSCTNTVVVDDSHVAWHINRFELVEPLEPKPFKEWVEGDIVKCVKGHSFGIMQNKTYIIGEIRYDENTLKVKGSGVWWRSNRFELVKSGQALESKHFSKWEVGDSIECIDNASLATTIGVIYEIKGMTLDKKFVEIVGDNGIFYALNSKLFKAVPLDNTSSENSPAKVTDMTETKPKETKPEEAKSEIIENIAGWYKDVRGYYTQIDAEGKITHNCPRTAIGMNFSERLQALGVKVEAPPQLPAGFQWPGGYIQKRAANKGEWYLTKDAFCPLRAVEYIPDTARFIVFKEATSVASQPQQGEEMQTIKALEMITQLQREIDALKAPVAKAGDTTPKIPAFFGYAWAATRGVFRFTVAEPAYRLYRLASRPFIVLAQTSCLAAVVAGIGYLGYAKAPSYQSIKAMIPTIQFGEAVEKSAPIEAE